MSELKPCPFCYGKDIDPEGWMSSAPNSAGYIKGPQCMECGATAESIERWNTRHNEAEELLNGLSDTQGLMCIPTIQKWAVVVTWRPGDWLKRYAIGDTPLDALRAAREAMEDDIAADIQRILRGEG